MFHSPVEHSTCNAYRRFVPSELESPAEIGILVAAQRWIETADPLEERAMDAERSRASERQEAQLSLVWSVTLPVVYGVPRV
jgi:hypothetical protein